MIRGPLLRTILLISCAHALVHLYELSLPSVEQDIASEYFATDIAKGKETTGLMSNCWRLAFGFGAFLAGWLVDLFGARRMLAIYLIGCGSMCLLAGSSQAINGLFMTMFTMGAFASIYHPAGLTLISHAAPEESRTWALGIHGIFGSIGIGVAPLLAGLLLSNLVGASWRQYYFLLAIPGIVLGAVFVFLGNSDRSKTSDEPTAKAKARAEVARWPSYFTLIVVAAMQGFIYSAMMAFLARYLSENIGIDVPQASRIYGKLLAGCVLIIGCIGQYVAGRYANPRKLERWMAVITLANVPFLVWMANASGFACAIAAGCFALVHFMHQPVYNSLIAKYTPASRRSLCYGFSFVMGFGVGSFGASFAGYCQSYFVTYLSLAGVALMSSLLAFALIRLNPPAIETA